MTKPTMEQIKKLRTNKILLAYWILEQKLLYYHPQFGACVSDERYDANEDKYKKLCKLFREEPTASNHVGFPWDTGSGRLVASKYDPTMVAKVNEMVKALK